MMGRLRFPCRDGIAEAVLDEEGRWHCPEVPALVRVLDTLYSPRRDGVYGDPRLARNHLVAAASWLHGTVE